MEIKTGEAINTVLHYIQKRSPPDFVLINNDEKYYCHFKILAMFSNQFASISDTPHLPSIILKTRYKLHFLQDVIDFFYGHPITLNFTNYKEITILSKFFGAEYLKDICMRASSFFDYSNILLESNYKDFTQSEIDFFSTFFQVFSNHSKFNAFPFELMKGILSSDKLTLINEDYLVHWILNDFCDIESRKKLLSFVVYEKVSFNGFKEIFSSIQNLEEILEKVQKEFVKDPRKRNLSTERNPRYFEKKDDLTIKILNFGLSTVFPLNIESDLSPEEDAVESKENEFDASKRSKDSQSRNFLNKTDSRPLKNSSETFSKAPFKAEISRSSKDENEAQKPPFFKALPAKNLAFENSPSNGSRVLSSANSKSGKGNQVDRLNKEMPIFSISGSETSSSDSLRTSETETEDVDQTSSSSSSSGSSGQQEGEEEEEEDFKGKKHNSLKHLFNNKEFNSRLRLESSESENSSDIDLNHSKFDKQDDIVKTIRKLMPKPSNK